MRKLRLDVHAIDVASFDPVAPLPGGEPFAKTIDATDCPLTAAADSCWCSEYNTCECT
ncbi:MAG TPA: hypothetical protein VHG08_03635 [Longimicrobium sp.]|nr:hypothetical protein [Longimicrobium sp.]